MITRELFEKIEDANGSFASWAVWEPIGSKKKSNMGPNNILDPDINPQLLKTLNTNIVMVGLNFSREIQNPMPFANFHDESRHAHDFKIRYAFMATPYYGAYMTDVLKDVVELNSQDVDKVINNPESLQKHIYTFEQELEFIESNKPLILAFGKKAYNILKRHLNKTKYNQLIQIRHYSDHIGEEEYKNKVMQQLKKNLPLQSDFVGLDVEPFRMNIMNDLQHLKQEVKNFRDARDWKQFHTPKDLVQAISIEAAELSELFLWVSQQESYKTAQDKREQLSEEMADVLIYLLSLSDVADIDLTEAVEDKLKKNNLKYPKKKATGKITKYTEL